MTASILDRYLSWMLKGETKSFIDAVRCHERPAGPRLLGTTRGRFLGRFLWGTSDASVACFEAGGPENPN